MAWLTVFLAWAGLVVPGSSRGHIHMCKTLGQLKWLGQLGLVDMVAEVFSEARESKSNIQVFFKLLLAPCLVMSHWLKHVLELSQNHCGRGIPKAWLGIITAILGHCMFIALITVRPCIMCLFVYLLYPSMTMKSSWRKGLCFVYCLPL